MLRDERLLITESEQGNVTVMYPDYFLMLDDVSRDLSVSLQKPVFALHVHDGDLWMYRLYANGQEVDRFNPLPDYWEELSDKDSESWSGDAVVVSQYWPGVREEQIANYLVRWNLDDEDETGAKAYAEDEFSTGEDWQIVDFMAKVGLAYPQEEQDNSGESLYRFIVSPPPSETPAVSLSQPVVLETPKPVKTPKPIWNWGRKARIKSSKKA